ncbi:unnamed protein product [Larinioides sclopetarius]|uniref:Uncharacterized protein n=1 Tax=Larinioides sclopetarius TaxID=280406 RepID=A0AAV2AZU4_9ARAC
MLFSYYILEEIFKKLGYMQMQLDMLLENQKCILENQKILLRRIEEGETEEEKFSCKLPLETGEEHYKVEEELKEEKFRKKCLRLQDTMKAKRQTTALKKLSRTG